MDTLRVAAARNIVPGDRYNSRGLQTAGAEISRLMAEAAAVGVRLAQFARLPEQVHGAE